MNFVLDSSAMIAYLRAERGGPVVAAAITGDDNRCFAHAVNLCEVYYDFHRSEGVWRLPI